METIFSDKVKEALQVEESLAKHGMNDVAVFNRCLDFCNAIYNKDRNVLEDLRNNTIDNHVVYQIMGTKQNLIDKSQLDQDVVEELILIYNRIKKQFTGE